MDRRVFKINMAQLEDHFRSVTWKHRIEPLDEEHVRLVVGFAEGEQILDQPAFARATVRRFGFSRLLPWGDLAMEARMAVQTWAMTKDKSWVSANMPNLHKWADSVVPDVSVFEGSELVRTIVRSNMKTMPLAKAMGTGLLEIPYGPVYRQGLECIMQGLVPCAACTRGGEWAVIAATAKAATSGLD